MMVAIHRGKGIGQCRNVIIVKRRSAIECIDLIKKRCAVCAIFALCPSFTFMHGDELYENNAF